MSAPSSPGSQPLHPFYNPAAGPPGPNPSKESLGPVAPPPAQLPLNADAAKIKAAELAMSAAQIQKRFQPVSEGAVAPSSSAAAGGVKVNLHDATITKLREVVDSDWLNANVGIIGKDVKFTPNMARVFFEIPTVSSGISFADFGPPESYPIILQPHPNKADTVNVLFRDHLDEILEFAVDEKLQDALRAKYNEFNS